MILSRRPTATLTLAGLLLVVGCSSSSTVPSTSSGTTNTASTSASVSSSPSASDSSSSSSSSSTASPAPKYPSAAKKNTKAGAEEFATYFWDVVNFAWTTPDAGSIKSISSKACEECTKLEDMAGILDKLGRRFSDAPFTITSATRTKVLDDLVLVRVEGTQNKADLLSKDGTTVGSQVDAPVAWLMLLKWTGKKFAVEKLTHA